MESVYLCLLEKLAGGVKKPTISREICMIFNLKVDEIFDLRTKPSRPLRRTLGRASFIQSLHARVHIVAYRSDIERFNGDFIKLVQSIRLRVRLRLNTIIASKIGRDL